MRGSCTYAGGSTPSVERITIRINDSPSGELPPGHDRGRRHRIPTAPRVHGRDVLRHQVVFAHRVAREIDRRARNR